MNICCHVIKTNNLMDGFCPFKNSIRKNETYFGYHFCWSLVRWLTSSIKICYFLHIRWLSNNSELHMGMGHVQRLVLHKIWQLEHGQHMVSEQHMGHGRLVLPNAKPMKKETIVGRINFCKSRSSDHSPWRGVYLRQFELPCMCWRMM